MRVGFVSCSGIEMSVCLCHVFASLDVQSHVLSQLGALVNRLFLCCLWVFVCLIPIVIASINILLIWC